MNKLTAQIAAKYYGCPLLLTAKNIEGNPVIDKVKAEFIQDFEESSEYNYQLILKSLSEISNEDAIEVAKLSLYNPDSDYNCVDETIIGNVVRNEFGIHVDISARCFDGYISIHKDAFFISDMETELETAIIYQAPIIDLLRSKSYDCDNLLTTGEAVQKDGI